MDPAIKKRVEFYRGLFLLGPQDGNTLGPWWNLTTKEASQMADMVAATMFGCGGPGDYYYEPDVLKAACDCFRLQDGFRLDPENPLQQRLLLLILAHVVFGKPRKRGRAKDSKAWTTLKNHQLAALYLDLKGKQPQLSDNKLAEQIASRWRVDKEVIRKRLSGPLRGWIEKLEKMEGERPGSIEYYGGLLEKNERDLAQMLSYKPPHPKSCPNKYPYLIGQHFRF
jgi:hypothetical protein